MLTPDGRRKNRSKRGHNIVGRRIRQLREQMKPDVTQNDLAARVSVRGIHLDRPTITRIENGERFLRDYEIKAIAKALRVPVAALFEE